MRPPLGPCCFLPLLRSLAPSPSCCCWPPLAFSLVPVHTKAIMAQLSLYLVCFSCVLLGLFGVFCSLFLFVAVPVGSQLRTQDCRVLPAPSVHTHTCYGDFPSPRVSFWIVLEFVCFFRPTPSCFRQVVQYVY